MREGTEALKPADNPLPVNDFKDWRLELLKVHAARSTEDQEYILRTELLLESLEHALLVLLDEDGSLSKLEGVDAATQREATEWYRKSFKALIDQVWRESHRGHPARVTALAVCFALQQSDTGGKAIHLLKIRGYVRLAETLDAEQMQRALEAWFDRSKGAKRGRIGKYERVARMVRAIGLDITAATVEALWRHNQGFGKRRKRAE